MGRDPIDEIRGTYGDELRDRRIILVVTGSISAYKAPDIARELIRHGAEVYIVASQDALRFAARDTLAWSVGGRLITEMSYLAEHIYLLRDADLLLVAPATANTVAKAAYGVADTPATLAIHSALGYGKKVLIAPVMHLNMMENPLYREAVERLRRMGAVFIDPLVEEEKAKLPPTRDIKMEVFRALYPDILSGRKVVVTAGPTIEYIDPVRIITNKSSGKMGVYIAEEAYLMGAEVTLIHGPIRVEPYRKLDRIPVETTEEMLEATIEALEGADIFISAAAPVDYRPALQWEEKIDTRSTGGLDLELVLTPKIVAEARERFPDLYIVSFKALYNVSDDELIRAAAEHARRYGFNLTVANDVAREGAGFQHETNEVFIVGKSGELVKRLRGHKRVLARELLRIIAGELG